MTIKGRLIKLETQAWQARPLKVLKQMMHRPRELSSLELHALIFNCEPWQVDRELTTEELKAMLKQQIGMEEMTDEELKEYLREH